MSAMREWTEFEDWLEYYTGRELARTAAGRYEAMVNFGGPGAVVAYHFYARTAAGAAPITAVECDGGTFEVLFQNATVPGTPADRHWIHLGFIMTGRDYKRVTFTAPDGLSTLDCLCIVQVPRRVDSGEIERRWRQIARGNPEPLSGVPLGGVGAGKLEFCRDGLFRNLTINGNIDAPVWRTAGAFFAVRAEEEGRALARIVATEPLHGLTPMERIEFDGLYPRAVLRASDRYFPLRVEICATGAIIPRQVEDSALPLALFRVRLVSTSDRPVRVSLAMAMENLLGRGGMIGSLQDRQTFDEGYYRLWDERNGNVEQPWKAGAVEGLLFDGGEKQKTEAQGQYVLAVNGRVASRLMGWRPYAPSRVWHDFADTGHLPDAVAEPSAGEATAGAIAVETELRPGESTDFEVVFAWHVPCFRQTGETDYGHFYTNRFATACEVACYGLTHFTRLEAQSAEIPELLLHSTLPDWLARSLCNDAYTFTTTTWLTRDGRFAVNEGPTHMFGCMGTLDQKLYGSHYHTLFFPELDRTELLGFARSQAADGGIQHDLGYGHLEQKGRTVGWPDLSSALAILSLKHYQMTGDQAYIDEVYPCLVRALLEYQLGMDSDGDGIANISGVGNTFDSEKFEGTSSYIASLWLAALRALEDLARRRGDRSVAERCRTVFDKARAAAIEELWNGRFFVNYYDMTGQRRCPNSHISQVAGEFFSQLCGLGHCYGEAYTAQALRSVLALNCHPRLRFPTNEATPEGRMPSRLMWGWLPHARVFAGGLPILFGMVEEGLAVLERMDRVIREENRDNRWDLRLFYEPDTGKEHWGRFYMSAPSTWYVYQALVGYRWDKPAGLLALMPNLPPSWLPFEGPLFLPDLWAWLTVEEGGARVRLRVIKVFEQGLRVRTLVLWPHPGTLTVTVGDKVVPCVPASGHGRAEEVAFACELELSAGMGATFAWR
jgi:uncharacterized protein (DUF608 family)